MNLRKYTHSYSVILDDMDLSEYRLRPISAITYIQDSFARYCATMGIAAYDLFKYNLYWIVSEFNIEFLDKLPFWSEDLEVEIWISELTKLKIFVDYKISSMGKLFARGNSCWFLIDTETKRPEKTDKFLNSDVVLSEYTLGEHKKFALEDCHGIIQKTTHINNLFDLDFNRHVNNKSYINLACLTMPEGFIENHTLQAMNIKFIKETFLSDNLVCETYGTNSSDTYIHKITKADAPVCEILTKWIDKVISDESIVTYPLKVKEE